MTPPLGLDQEHVPQLGVRREDLAARREQRVGAFGDGRHQIAIALGDEAALDALHRIPSVVLAAGAEDGVERLMHRLVGFAQEDRVDVRRER